MGMSQYTKIIFGQRVERDDFDHMKEVKSYMRDVHPPTKFNPDTGEQNHTKKEEVFYEEWRPEYNQVAMVFDPEYACDEGEWSDELYNGGLDFNGVWAVETWNGELFVTESKEDIFDLGDVSGVNRLHIPDLYNKKKKVRATLERFNMWKEDRFGAWTHTYYA